MLFFIIVALEKLKGMSLMKIRQATIDDYDQIMTILKDGANQLAERGVDQWQGDYP